MRPSKEEEAVAVEAAAGAVVLFSSDTWHCSGPNTCSSPRRVFYAQYSHTAINVVPRRQPRKRARSPVPAASGSLQRAVTALADAVTGESRPEEGSEIVMTNNLASPSTYTGTELNGSATADNDNTRVDTQANSTNASKRRCELESGVEPVRGVVRSCENIELDGRTSAISDSSTRTDAEVVGTECPLCFAVLCDIHK